ncbi:MAG TPA: SDR family oxidoreductase [Chitinivibrionales bacterium]|nr:SDR family oxidoreductase [Chitinivibrionales bacterium]
MARFPCAGRTALVTGGAKRIGRHIALACGREGMNVVVHYHRSRQEAQLLVQELTVEKITAWAVGGALDTSEMCDKLIRTASSLCGNSLWLLVNNASMFPARSLDKVSFGDLAASVRVNAWAPLCLSRAFAETARPGGSIVNLLDARIAGYDKSHVAYILSKHLFAAITRQCAIEFAPRIRVNAVAPGLILPPAGKTEAYLNKLKNTVPLRMHGRPEDLAAAVVFLAKSPFVTGETIFVDGGKHLLAHNTGF